MDLYTCEHLYKIPHRTKAAEKKEAIWIGNTAWGQDQTCPISWPQSEGERVCLCIYPLKTTTGDLVMDNLTIFTTLVFIFLYMMVTSENSELCTA